MGLRSHDEPWVDPADYYALKAEQEAHARTRATLEKLRSDVADVVAACPHDCTAESHCGQCGDLLAAIEP